VVVIAPVRAVVVAVGGRLALGYAGAVVVAVAVVAVAAAQGRHDRGGDDGDDRDRRQAGDRQRRALHRAVDQPAEGDGDGRRGRDDLERAGQGVGEPDGLGRLGRKAGRAGEQPQRGDGQVQRRGAEEPAPLWPPPEGEGRGPEQLGPPDDDEERPVRGRVVEVGGREGEVDDGGAERRDRGDVAGRVAAGGPSVVSRDVSIAAPPRDPPVGPAGRPVDLRYCG